MARFGSLPAVASLALLTLATPHTASSQTHSRDDFVRGQPATLSFWGLPSSSFGVVAFSFGGVGAGPCSPVLCLDVLDPMVFSPVVPSDPFGNASFAVLVASETVPYDMATQGVWLDFSAATPGIVKSTVVGGDIAPLSVWNDDFAGSALSSSWSTSSPNAFSTTVSSGHLRLVAAGSGPGFSWGDGRRGGLVHRDLYGDAAFSVDIHVFDPNLSGEPIPAGPRQCGGILFRGPDSRVGHRDWIAVSLGSGPNGTLPKAVSAIDTLGATSQYVDVNHSGAIDPTSATLRIERHGPSFTCLFRDAEGDPFTPIATFQRPNWPLGLEVGMFVSAASPTTSVASCFDEARFENL